MLYYMALTETLFITSGSIDPAQVVIRALINKGKRQYEETVFFPTDVYTHTHIYRPRFISNRCNIKGGVTTNKISILHIK